MFLHVSVSCNVSAIRCLLQCLCNDVSIGEHLPTQDIVELEAKLATARTELQLSQQTVEQRQERLEEVEARSRDLYDTTVRLEAHISDLESRKRAPLYQKKQEEELKAAIEKAQECEIRAVDAEIKHKEAKVLGYHLPDQLLDQLLLESACLVPSSGSASYRRHMPLLQPCYSIAAGCKPAAEYRLHCS